MSGRAAVSTLRALALARKRHVAAVKAETFSADPLCALTKATSIVRDHRRTPRIVSWLARPTALAPRRLTPASTIIPCCCRGEKQQNQHAVFSEPELLRRIVACARRLRQERCQRLFVNNLRHVPA